MKPLCHTSTSQSSQITFHTNLSHYSPSLTTTSSSRRPSFFWKPLSEESPLSRKSISHANTSFLCNSFLEPNTLIKTTPLSWQPLLHDSLSHNSLSHNPFLSTSHLSQKLSYRIIPFSGKPLYQNNSSLTLTIRLHFTPRSVGQDNPYHDNPCFTINPLCHNIISQTNPKYFLMLQWIKFCNILSHENFKINVQSTYELMYITL